MRTVITERRPCDLAVKVALIVFKKHFGRLFKVKSDQPDDEWLRANQLVVSMTGRKADFTSNH